MRPLIKVENRIRKPVVGKSAEIRVLKGNLIFTHEAWTKKMLSHTETVTSGTCHIMRNLPPAFLLSDSLNFIKGSRG